MIITKIQGGLGNQLFQYATGKSLAIYLKKELFLDLTFYENPNHRKIYRLDKFKLPFKVANSSEIIKIKNSDEIPWFFRKLRRIGMPLPPYYKKSHFIEKEIENLFRNKNRISNVYIEGWFAQENYFKEHRTILLNELNADGFLKGEKLDIKKEIQSSNSVSVHIRRGDYLTNPFFKSLPVDYYGKAIEMAKGSLKKPTFYLFSDDMAWVKKEYSYLADAFFIENNSFVQFPSSTVGDIQDLMLMRSCRHQIIANSTFSWWGAWLNINKEKQVYYPSCWFNDKIAQRMFETNDFIPAAWHKVTF